MSFQIHFFNIWAILVAFISSMLIGALWYSPLLFGNIWLKLIGKTKEDISRSEGNKSMAFSMLPALISTLLIYLLINFTQAAGILDALIIGSIASLGFIGTNAFNLVIFEERSIKLSLINIAYPFVAYNIAAVIIFLWR